MLRDLHGEVTHDHPMNRSGAPQKAGCSSPVRRCGVQVFQPDGRSDVLQLGRGRGADRSRAVGQARACQVRHHHT